MTATEALAHEEEVGKAERWLSDLLDGVHNASHDAEKVAVRAYREIGPGRVRLPAPRPVPASQHFAEVLR